MTIKYSLFAAPENFGLVAIEYFESRVKIINRIMSDTIFIIEGKVLPMEIVSPK